MSLFSTFMRVTLEAELTDLMNTPTDDVTPEIEMRILYTLELLDGINQIGGMPTANMPVPNNTPIPDPESDSDSSTPDTLTDTDADDENEDEDEDDEEDDHEHFGVNTGQLIGGVIDALGNIYAVFHNAAPPVYEDVPVPLSEAEISAFEIPGCIDTTEYPRCAVCMCDFDAESCGDVYKLPCTHHYHMSCIREWFKLKPFCPCCKQDMRTMHY